jgi:hypothetical protein
LERVREQVERLVAREEDAHAARSR